jgi:ABC-type transport system involved in multi-copper enzyme maturation permease subunit
MNRHDQPLIRGIVSFIGIDYSLMKRSGEDNIAKFYVSGFFVAAIFCICFLAVYYAFDLMFHKWYAEVFLSTFFSLTFLTIYLLLIQTFSKETLPTSYKITFFSTSNITRICFVLLISFLIAQPVKIFMLRDQLENDITAYKAKLYNEFSSNVAKLYQKDLYKLEQRRRWYDKMTYDTSTAALITENNQQILTINTRMELDNQDAQQKIDGSDFFLKRIEFAGKYRSSWWICLLVIVIFSFPVYLIYSISDDSKYYSEKRASDRHLVLKEYRDFKKIYHDIFKQKYGLDIQFHEAFEDAPFNWVRIAEPERGSNDDFLEDMAGHGL